MGPRLVFFGRVVEHDVDPHFDVVVVGARHEIGEFLVGVGAGGVLTMCGAERQRHVPPVVDFVGVELVHRQQFEHGDADRSQAREFVDQRAVGAGIGAVTSTRHSADVCLVDHQWS